MRALIVVAIVTLVAGAAAQRRVLVLDLQNDGVGTDVARITQETLGSVLHGLEDVQVTTASDLRSVVEVDAQKRLSGCDSEGCLAELAGAFGADVIVHGSIGKLGELIVVNLSAYDASANASIGRETFQVRNVEAVPDAMRAHARALLGLAPAVPPWQGPGWITAGVGAAVAVGSAAVVALGYARWADVRAPADGGPTAADRDGARALGRVAAVAAAVGVGAAAVGVGVAVVE